MSTLNYKGLWAIIVWNEEDLKEITQTESRGLEKINGISGADICANWHFSNSLTALIFVNGQWAEVLFSLNKWK